MDNRKIQQNVSDAINNLNEIVYSLSVDHVGDEQFRKFLNTRLAKVAEDVAMCGDEINGKPDESAAKDVDNATKKSMPQPKADFSSMSFKKSCGILSMGYPSFCAKTLIDTYNEDGLKPALNYLLNYVAKENAEISVEFTGTGIEDVNFSVKVDGDSAFARNSPTAISIINSFLLAFGYNKVSGKFVDNSFKFTASYREAVENDGESESSSFVIPQDSFLAFVTTFK